VILNIVGFGLFFNSRRFRKPFFIGFEIAGLLAAIGSLGTCWFFPDTVGELFNTVVYPLVPLTLQRVVQYLPPWVRDDISGRELYVTLPIYLVFGPIITAPIAFAQLLLALTGGLVFRRLAGGRAAGTTRESARKSPEEHERAQDRTSNNGTRVDRGQNEKS